MSDPHTLADLIRQAESTAQKQAEAKLARKGKPVLFRLIFTVLLLGVVCYAGIKLSDALAPPSQQKVANDLGNVVERAHKLIDGIKQDTGELPKTLPNAALAAVVQYEPDPDKSRYRLTATVMGIRVTLQPNGHKITETGIQQ